MLYRLFAIIVSSFSFAFVLPHHGKAVSTSVVINNVFGSQPGRAVLRCEKRAIEEAALKKKEAAGAVKKTEVDKAKAEERAAELFFQMTHRVAGPRRGEVEYGIVM